MPIIPTPEEARKLRVQFDGNPIIDEAEIQLRQRGLGLVDIEQVAQALEAFPLTDRERQGTLARFVRDEELVDDVEDGWECTDCDCYHPCAGRVCPEQCACHRTCGCADYPGNEQ